MMIFRHLKYATNATSQYNDTLESIGYQMSANDEDNVAESLSGSRVN